jgi:predicted SAM-dependent methyltransferase
MSTWKKWIRMKLYSPLRRATARVEFARYVATTPKPRINVGCGKNMPPGWLNVDLFPHVGATHMNAAVRWPVADNTFYACLCEHVIEHVPRADAETILLEAFRTLVPGARIRLITPNLEFFAQLILGQRPPEDEQLYQVGLNRVLGVKDASRCDIVNQIFFEHGHQYIYTPLELGRLMTKVGFVDIKQTAPDSSMDQLFENAEGHSDVVGAEFNAIEAFALEGSKPHTG